MDRDRHTWQLAKLMLDQHGQHAMYGARAISETFKQSAADGVGTTCHDVVRAMDFLLSDEGSMTVH